MIGYGKTKWFWHMTRLGVQHRNGRNGLFYLHLYWAMPVKVGVPRCCRKVIFEARRCCQPFLAGVLPSLPNLPPLIDMFCGFTRMNQYSSLCSDNVGFVDSQTHLVKERKTVRALALMPLRHQENRWHLGTSMLR